MDEKGTDLRRTPLVLHRTIELEHHNIQTEKLEPSEVSVNSQHEVLILGSGLWNGTSDKLCASLVPRAGNEAEQHHDFALEKTTK